jgi:hypothetical protein
MQLAEKLDWKGLIIMTEDALMKQGTVILQSCTVVPSSSSSIKVEEEEDSGISIKVEIPEPISFPSIKTETDEVSHLPVCPLLDTCHHYP